MVFRVFCVPRHGFSVFVVKRRGGGSATLPLGPKTYPQKNPNPAGPPCAGVSFLLSFTSSAEEPGLAGARMLLFSRGEKGKTT